MKCMYCKTNMVETDVNVYGAEALGKAETCPECGYTKFDRRSCKKIVDELKENEELFVRIPAKMLKEIDLRYGYNISTEGRKIIIRPT